MTYDGSFIFPPRPQAKIKPETVERYDNGEYLSSVKFDGDCLVCITDGQEVKIFNRHGQPMLPSKLKGIDFRGLHRGTGWMAVCAELMDSKAGEDGLPMSELAIIHDIVAFDKYLVGKTYIERVKLLDELYPSSQTAVMSGGAIRTFEHARFTGVQGVLKAVVYSTYFSELYDDVIKVPAYEGLVLKKMQATLEHGMREDNNSSWILKCRKQSRMYRI